VFVLRTRDGRPTRPFALENVGRLPQNCLGWLGRIEQSNSRQTGCQPPVTVSGVLELCYRVFPLPRVQLLAGRVKHHDEVGHRGSAAEDGSRNPTFDAPRRRLDQDVQRVTVEYRDSAAADVPPGSPHGQPDRHRPDKEHSTREPPEKAYPRLLAADTEVEDANRGRTGFDDTRSKRALAGAIGAEQGDGQAGRHIGAWRARTNAGASSGQRRVCGHDFTLGESRLYGEAGAAAVTDDECLAKVVHHKRVCGLLLNTASACLVASGDPAPASL
jgi:hypothetical protein